MAHDALVTNVFRLRRGLTDSGICPLCNHEEESLVHMGRDCSRVAQVWARLAENGVLRISFLWISSLGFLRI